jgi:glycerophosphoryl diester phosphodiesterase
MIEWLTATPFAHRGLHDNDRPENTLGAFEAAVVAGYGIELDVHLTSDEQLVVIHDDDTRRMTGEHHVVSESTYEALRSLAVGGSSYNIPLLSEVISLVGDQVPLLIEIKSGAATARTCRVVQDLIAGKNLECAVQSFDHRVVRWFATNAKSTTRGQISGNFAGESLPRHQKLLLRSMVLNLLTKPHYIAFDIRAMPSLPVKFWRTVLRTPLLVWTISDQNSVARAKRYANNYIFEGVRP